ncbi:RodZ domain-containing protein [Gilvimarinus agarilyticus]|uniref:RodZ domain-containing protein n=1 Tax=Gilvimarinus agarilyticus TaxID=679259 RepID=UPI0005A1F264|nr:RodZ domain-containing protein [Gilvimarinus agarilyticus]
MSEELEPQTQVTPGPGGKLALERERQGKSREQIASALNIQLDKIVALESDQYEKLFSVVFTRGYLRSYGKYLGLDGEALVREFEADFAKAEAPAAPSESLNVKMSASRSVWPGRVALIVVLLALLGGVYWYMNLASPEVVSQAEPAALPESAPEPSRFSGSQADTDAAATLDDTTPDYTPAIELVASGDGESGLAASENPSVALDEPAVDETAQDTSEAEAPQEQAANVVRDMSIGTTSSADGTILDELVLRFDNECWLEVLDSNGDSLVADLQRENTSLTLHGVAPFNVKLGNPTGVEIALNGDVVAVPDADGADKVVRFDVDSKL